MLVPMSRLSSLTPFTRSQTLTALHSAAPRWPCWCWTVALYSRLTSVLLKAVANTMASIQNTATVTNWKKHGTIFSHALAHQMLRQQIRVRKTKTETVLRSRVLACVWERGWRSYYFWAHALFLHISYTRDVLHAPFLSLLSCLLCLRGVQEVCSWRTILPWPGCPRDLSSNRPCSIPCD